MHVVGGLYIAITAVIASWTLSKEVSLVCQGIADCVNCSLDEIKEFSATCSQQKHDAPSWDDCCSGWCACPTNKTISGATSSSDSKPSTRRPVLYFTGDSLTENGANPDTSGWTALMQNHYILSTDVTSRGIAGYNTKWFIEAALPVIKRELEELRSASLITLWLGTNDAVLLNGSDSGKHVPLAAYKDNLIRIVHTYQKAAPNARILLITPPPVDDAARKSRSTTGLLDYSDDEARKYARACVDAARELDTHVLDLYAFFHTLSETERAASLEDGLHFSAQGNRLVYEQLLSKITEAFPEFAAQLEVGQFPPASTFLDA